MKKSIPVLVVGTIFVLVSGCMDGPFYNLKKANPFYLSQWREDSARAPTYDERIAELKNLESKITRMGATEQEEWAIRLEKIVQDDPSPEMRRQAVRCAEHIAGPTSTRILNAASADDVEKVRIAACQAWRTRGDEAAKNMLVSIATSDADGSVRQTAIDSLSQFNDPEVLGTLAKLLDDKSPAVQYSVAQSLATLTGQNHGGDISAWKQLMNNQIPASSQPMQGSAVRMAGSTGNLPIPQ